MIVKPKYKIGDNVYVGDEQGEVVQVYMRNSCVGAFMDDTASVYDYAYDIEFVSGKQGFFGEHLVSKEKENKR